MGMFDTVRCEVELPGEPKPDKDRAWLQTKDFECAMDVYRITRERRLLGPDGDMDFHGVLNFYTLVTDPKHAGRGPGTWFEYEAKFTDGNLVGIECIEVSVSQFGSHDRTILWPVQHTADTTREEPATR